MRLIMRKKNRNQNSDWEFSYESPELNHAVTLRSGDAFAFMESVVAVDASRPSISHLQIKVGQLSLTFECAVFANIQAYFRKLLECEQQQRKGSNPV